jgi:hypothetical protein
MGPWLPLRKAACKQRRNTPTRTLTAAKPIKGVAHSLQCGRRRARFLGRRWPVWIMTACRRAGCSHRAAPLAEPSLSGTAYYATVSSVHVVLVPRQAGRRRLMERHSFENGLLITIVSMRPSAGSEGLSASSKRATGPCRLGWLVLYLCKSANVVRMLLQQHLAAHPSRGRVVLQEPGVRADGEAACSLARVSECGSINGRAWTASLSHITMRCRRVGAQQTLTERCRGTT